MKKGKRQKKVSDDGRNKGKYMVCRYEETGRDQEEVKSMFS